MIFSKKYCILILLLFFGILVSGCITGADTDNDGKVDDLSVDVSQEEIVSSIYVQDSDSDGYADEEDDFPNDSRYHSDKDGDGYADEVDDFPNDSRYHSDKDGDGYADEVDDFPNDSRYHSDYDKDGYADEVDDFKSDSRYHATCTVCDGSGKVDKDYTRYVEYTDESSWTNKGIFNPDYYGHITVTNIDSHEGVFEVKAWYEDNGVNMWEETQRFNINKGDTHEFIFHYDADETMDVFRWVVHPPTYIETIESTCATCNGNGKI